MRTFTEYSSAQSPFLWIQIPTKASRSQLPQDFVKLPTVNALIPNKLRFKHKVNWIRDKKLSLASGTSLHVPFQSTRHIHRILCPVLLIIFTCNFPPKFSFSSDFGGGTLPLSALFRASFGITKEGERTKSREWVREMLDVKCHEKLFVRPQNLSKNPTL